MNQNELLKAKGELHVVLNRVDGSVEQFDVKNLVVDNGLNYIVERMKNDSGDTGGLAKMSHMALGSDNTAATAADSTLGSELARVAFTSATVTNNEIVYVATFGAGVATGNVYEAGIFNASSGGVMLCHTVFGLITKAAGDSMTVTWTITVS